MESAQKLKFLKKGEKAMTVKDARPDPRFVVKSFYVMVPDDYNHSTCFKSFRKEHHKEFSSYNFTTTDKHFSGVTTKLVGGQSFRVDVVRVNVEMPYQDCLAYLENQGVILVGAQGASLIWKQKREELPLRRSISLDKRDALHKDSNGHHKIPSIRRYSDGHFDWFLSRFEYPCREGYHLLCFHEK